MRDKCPVDSRCVHWNGFDCYYLPECKEDEIAGRIPTLSSTEQQLTKEKE